MRRYTTAALLCVALAQTACANDAPRKPTRAGASVELAAGTPSSQHGDVDEIYLVFADVTRSLTPEEHQSVRNIVRDVISAIPPRSRLYVFPILEDVPRSPAIFTGVLPATEGSRDRLYVEQLRVAWSKTIEKRLHDIESGPATGRNHTCISGALRKAAEVASTITPTEIILVSDMLEDCSDSLLGGQLSLEHRDLTREVKRAHALPRRLLLDLHSANVTAVLPTVPTSKTTIDIPPLHEVEQFWREVLDRCHDRKENFCFTTQVPTRLLDASPSR